MKLTFDVPEEMAEKIAEDIKVALEEYKKKQIWPQEGDEYYLILSDGRITWDRYYANNPIDKNKFRLGNMFKTKEEAEFKLGQLKVLHELEQLADDDQEWDYRKCHYNLIYKYNEDVIYINCNYEMKTCQFYFNSEESAQAAIDKIGKDRLKKYYFCIPEE